MTSTELNDTIKRIIGDLTAIVPSEIQASDRLREDLGMDSVSSMELISMLSEELAIEVELEEAMDIKDIAGIIALAKGRLNAPA